MSFDSLLVFATLIITAYTVIPEYRRLDIKLRWGLFDSVVFISAATLIHYLLFFPTFKTLGLTPGLSLHAWALTPKNTAYLVLFAALFIITLHLKTIKLPRRKIFKFRNYANELLNDRKYDILVKSLESKIYELRRIYNGNFLLAKVKKKYGPKSLWEMAAYLEDKKKKKSSKIASIFKRRLSKLAEKAVTPLPDYKGHQLAARDAVRAFLTNKEFCSYVASSRPYFAIEVFESNFFETEEFFENYFFELMSNKSSALFWEVKNNQNVSSNHVYGLPEENKLLHYLFSDSNKAYELSVWRPIGEYLISYLNALENEKDNSHYNKPMEDFMERGQMESPLFVGIYFFDIMVSSALHQGIRWHMWLYYFPHFTKRIVKNYNQNQDNIDLSSEFPTRYHFFLYRLFDIMRDWIECAKHLPPDQQNVKMEDASLNHDNGNIIKSSILAFGQCLKYVLSSDKFTQDFKAYICQIGFRLYFELHASPYAKVFSDVLLLSMIKGGIQFSTETQEIKEALREAFAQFDKIPYEFDAVKTVQAILDQ